MRWFSIADINLNEPANLFQLLGQLQADREDLTVSPLYLSVCLPIYLSGCFLPIGLSVTYNCQFMLIIISLCNKNTRICCS